MLAITPRTGSTHFCVALHQAGQSVEPTEIFNPRGPAAAERDRRGVASFAAYIASFARDPDTAFIFKTSWHDAAPIAPFLRSLFPDLRVVFIDRKNIAAQAVSLFRAEVLNLWHRRPGQAASLPPNGEDKFDLQRICAILANLEAEKRLWESFFAAQGILPLRLRYEDFETDVNIALRSLIPALNLPLRTDLPSGAGLQQLADATSQDWVLRVQRHIFNMS
jgi:LPS sulfotransferase NodH